MEDEPMLPALPAHVASNPFLSDQSRKRARLSPPISSDPPNFSSDDDPSADNYTQARHKQIYRGPWYKQRLASDHDQELPEGGSHKKRTFERQFDSGVFMGSDGTDIDEGTDELEPTNDTLDLPLRPSRITQTIPQTSPEESFAQGHIEECLETGNETIDLSSRGLKSISNATIKPLAAFSCIPQDNESRIEPMLKIYLAANYLTTLPLELLNLNRLTVFSVRANQIHELPTAIGNLSNLEQLNISINKMQYLPFEILQLFSVDSNLKWIGLHPNPFHEPRYPEDRIEEEAPYKIGLANRLPRRGARQSMTFEAIEEQLKPWSPKWKVTYQARTEVRFLDSNGAHLEGPQFSNEMLLGPRKNGHGLPVAKKDDKPAPPTSRGALPSRVPSLLEVALKACSKNPQLPFLKDYLPDAHPEAFPGLLDMVAAKKESGATRCTICKRDFIVPRTEWIEWWEIERKSDKAMASAASPLRQMENERDVLERSIPLIRRGCSWLCIPEIIAVQEEGNMPVDG